MAEVRRGLVLQAAREAFLERGLDGASLREIARRAGYSPGALYGYFASKEAVYAALLEDSLDRLTRQVQAAAAGDDGSGDAPAAPAALARRLQAQAAAFFEFYREHPRDLDLGFYLFQGMQPRGLTPALNERLNQRLKDALAPIEATLRAAGQDPAGARAEVTAFFAQAVGLLLLSHTGRIRTFGPSSQALLAAYLVQLCRRCGLPAPDAPRRNAA
ncbi:transcriptional regulator, TetR family [Piscinibacter sakaiensis]|uniref:Transcriptional regulator, TetR family n=2 Tax=Piscinibacter sakaiensis TaxID=1547922 RepID=A0A0K8NWS4_PISS1|nr:transcriptional regulator, TetR family [Piscinibacter sakaiensis]